MTIIIDSSYEHDFYVQWNVLISTGKVEYCSTRSWKKKIFFDFLQNKAKLSITFWKYLKTVLKPCFLNNNLYKIIFMFLDNFICWYKNNLYIQIYARSYMKPSERQNKKGINANHISLHFYILLLLISSRKFETLPQFFF